MNIERSFGNFLDWNILHGGLAVTGTEKLLQKGGGKDGVFALNARLSLKEESFPLQSADSDRISFMSRTQNDNPTEKISIVNDDIETHELHRTDKDTDVNELVSYIKSLTQLPFIYQTEKKRSHFNITMQKSWDSIENLIIHCFLHHSNLITLLRANSRADISLLTSQPNIKDQLTLISKRRNEVITFMLNEVKIDNEYQHNVLSVYEVLKTEYVNKFILPRIEKANEKKQQQEFANKEAELKNKKELIKKKIAEKQASKKGVGKKSKANKDSSKNISLIDDKSTIQKEETSYDDSAFYYVIPSEMDSLLINKEVLQKCRQSVAEYFEGRNESLRKIFKMREIEFTKEPKENNEILLKNIISSIKVELEKSQNGNTEEIKEDEKEKSSKEFALPSALNLESPFQKVANFIRERAKFLLQVNPVYYMPDLPMADEPLTIQRDDSLQKSVDPNDDDLEPIGYIRALTTENKIKPKDFGETERNHVRNWLEFYKNWKSQMINKEEDLKSTECSPIYAVAKFLTFDQPLNVATLHGVIFRSDKRAALRVIGLQLYNNLVNLLSKTNLDRVTLCFLPSMFKDLTVLENIQTTNQSFKTIISEVSFRSAKTLMSKFIEDIETMTRFEVFGFYKAKKMIALEDMMQFETRLEEFQNFFKKIIFVQTEVFTLINNQNFAEHLKRKIFSDQLEFKKERKLITHYIAANFKLCLVLLSSRSLSFDFRDASTIFKKCFKISNVILNQLGSVLNEKIAAVEIIVGLLQVELGELNELDKYSKNTFNRIFDSIGEERVVFLLKNLRVYLRRLFKSGLKSPERDDSIWKPVKDKLLVVIFHTNNVRLVKISLRCLEILNQGLSIFDQILKDDSLKRTVFVEKIYDRINKAQFLTKINLFSSKNQNNLKESSKVVLENSQSINDPNSNDLLNLLHKIGDLASPSLRSVGEESQENSDFYVLYLHLFNEEDLCPLVRVFYHWEQLYPTFTKRLPKTIEEYREMQKKSGTNEKNDPKFKKTMKAEQGFQFFQQMSNKMRLSENILQNIPDFDIQDENLPIAWFLNNSNIFKNMKIHKFGRKIFIPKTTRKMWEIKNLNKLIFTLSECLKLLKPPVFVSAEKKSSSAENQKDPVRTNSEHFNEGFNLDNLFKEDRKASMSENPKPEDQIENQVNAIHDVFQNIVNTELLGLKPMNDIDPDLMFDSDSLDHGHDKLLASDVMPKLLENKPEADNKVPKPAIPEAQARPKPSGPDRLPKLAELMNNQTTLLNNPKFPMAGMEREMTLQINSQSGKNYVNATDEERAKIEDDFIQSYRLLTTLLEICKSVQAMSTFLNYMGYSNVILSNGVFEDKYEKAEELAYLINIFLHKKMAEIPFANVGDESIMKKLVPVMKFVNDNQFSLDLSVSIAKSSLIPSINKFVRYSSKLRVPPEDYVKYANKYVTIAQNITTAQSKTFILKLLANFVKSVSNKNHSVKNEIQKLFKQLLSSEKIVSSETQDEKVKLGLLLLTTNWMNDFAIGEKVRFPIGDQEFKIVASPSTIGKRHILVINEKEPKGLIKLTEQSFTDNDFVPFDHSIVESMHLELSSNLISSLKAISERSMLVSETMSNQEFEKNIQGKMKLILMIRLYFSLMENNPNLQNDEFRQALLERFNETMGDYKNLSKSFVGDIEMLIDYQTPTSIIVPEHFKAPSGRYPFEVERRKVSARLEEVLTTRGRDFEGRSHTPATPGYAVGLPLSPPRSTDYKMLKYWEKHIIPKILNFVKGSLSPYEIEDFFEQMRIELRKENHSAASNIAYILCDQKLPNDCALPELNYDWTSLDLDEMKIGQAVSIKIKDDRNPFSYLFESFQKMGVFHVLGRVIFKDPMNNCVNVLISDLHQANVFSVWVPQQAVRPIEQSITYPPRTFPLFGLLLKMQNSFDSLLKSATSEFFFKELLSEKRSLNLETDMKVLRLLIQKELKGECLSQWLKVNGNVLSDRTQNKVLNSIISRLENQNLLPDFLKVVEEDVKKLITFIGFNNYSFDMKNKLEGDIYTSEKATTQPERPSNLNIFNRNEEVAGLAIEFKEDSNLFKVSGLKFFSDEDGINVVEHIHSTQKSGLQNILPLVFDFPNVYYTHYFNSEALPVYMKNQSTTKLDCTIFAVPFSWNFVMWSLDIVSSNATIKQNAETLASTFKIVACLFSQFRGPNVCKQLLLKLLSRVVVKIRSLLKKSEITAENKNILVKAIVESHIKLPEILSDFEHYFNSASTGLYSSLLQDLSEFLAVYSSIVFSYVVEKDSENNNQIKELSEDNKISAIVSNENTTLTEIRKLFALAEFLSDPQTVQIAKKETQDLRGMILETLHPLNFFDNFLIVQNIPKLDPNLVRKLIEENMLAHKLKILAPEHDIYVPINSDDFCVGYAIILFDGWEFPEPSTFSFENGDNNENEDSEAPKEEPEDPEDKLWECEVCTLMNADDSAACIACEVPKPANPVYPNLIKKQEELKVKQAEQAESAMSTKKRLQKFKDALLKSFERSTPDKRIEVKRFERKKWAEIESSNEILEFLMVRMTTETFQSKLLEACQDITSKFSKEVEETLNLKTSEQLHEYFISLEPLELFQKLADFGYDLWLEKSGLAQFSSDVPKLVFKKDMERFLEYIEQDLCYESEHVLDFSPLDFRLEFKTPLVNLDIYEANTVEKLRYNESKIFFYKLMKFNNYSNLTLRVTIFAIQMFNVLLKKFYKLFNIVSVESSTISEFQSNNECLSLGSLMSNLRDYWLATIKNGIIQEFLHSTSVIRDETPKVYIERLTKEREIMVEKRGGNVDNGKRGKKEGTEDKNLVFLQAHKQLAETSATLLRPVKPKGSEPFISFEIIFKGEHVMGEAGPYRQFFSDISGELQPSALHEHERDFFLDVNRKFNLLIPSPNRANELGDFKEKFVVNPSNKSSYYLQLYEFLGLLMGCAFRTGTFLTIDLPTLFWKKLVGQQIAEEDLQEIDKGVFELVRFFKTSDKETLENDIFQTFTVLLSDKTMVELIPDGRNVRVTADNKVEFISKVLEARIEESALQIAAIRKGVVKIIPEALLHCLNARDLERRICGRNEVNFALLKRHTRYSGGLKEESRLVQDFWKVLFSLTHSDKLRFVKFCWGQERLPSTSAGFESSSIRFMIKPSQYNGSQDGLLPRADTCFFNFELPNYSTFEIMKERILLAIHTDSDSMNAEEAHSENQNYEEQHSWVSYSDMSQDRD